MNPAPVKINELIEPLLKQIRIGDTDREDKNFSIIETEKINTGYDAFDEFTGGLTRGDLIVIGGRPGMGTVVLAQNFAINLSCNQGLPSLFVSLSLTKGTFAQQILSHISMVDITEIRRSRVKKESSLRKIEKASVLLNESPLYVEDNLFEISAIERCIIEFKKKKDIQAVFIDHLHLIDCGIEMDLGKREREVSLISRTLKRLAKNLCIPIVLISSLTRQVEIRLSKHPQLHELRDSGAIEDNADLIIFLYRDEVYDKSENNFKRGIADLIIAKNNVGRQTGVVSLAYLSKYLRFENLAVFEGCS